MFLFSFLCSAARTAGPCSHLSGARKSCLWPGRAVSALLARARNALAGTLPDAAGHRPHAAVITPGAPAALALRTAGQRLVVAARAAGMPAALSSDAGAYLCNYLCWRANDLTPEIAPRLVAFVHVPKVRRFSLRRADMRRPPFAFADLVRAGESIMLAAIAAARVRR